jgi:hypothetical protein
MQNIPMYGLALFVVAVIVVGVLWTLAVRRRRWATWRRFADKHDLQFQESPEPRVTGTVRKFPISLYIEHSSSEDGELGVEDVVMSVRLSNAPQKLVLESNPGVIGEVAKSLENEVIETGDPQFDEQMEISEGKPEDVREYLNDQRRRALLELVNNTGSAVVELQYGELRVKERERISNLSHLDGLLEALIQAAEHME